MKKKSKEGLGKKILRGIFCIICPWCGEKHISRSSGDYVCKKTKKKVYVCFTGKHAYKDKSDALHCRTCQDWESTKSKLRQHTGRY